MSSIKAFYHQPVDANELKDLGILDVLRTPIEGTTPRHILPWKKVGKLTMFVFTLEHDASPPQPYYELQVDFSGRTPRPVPFLVRLDPKSEDILVSTISGTEAGMARLGPEQSQAVFAIMQRAIDAPLEDRSTKNS